MPIGCDQWPMNLLTKPAGEKDRKLLVHPKPAVERKGIRRNEDGKLYIIDRKFVKVKTPNILIPEMKEAGHRHFLFRDEDGKYGVFGRRLNVNKTYTDIYPKLKGKWKHPDLPKGTVIDFELVWPGHPDSEVVTAIKECPEELRMKAFAVPVYRGFSIAGSDTIDYIQGRQKLCKLVGSENVTKKFLPIEIDSENVVEKMEYLLRAAENMGVEGWVLKAFHCKEWYKLKGIQEADVFVIGFKISNAETRKGMVTAVKVGVYDKDHMKEIPIGNVSGFSLEEMEQMTEAYNKCGDAACGPKANPYLYSVLRIVYQEMAGQGGLKHAFRDCWRTDKDADSCYMDQFE